MKFTVLSAILSAFVYLPETQSADPTCGAPPEVPFGSVTSMVQDESPVGTIVSYTCQFGYVVDGAIRTSECELSEDGEDTEWREPQMSCIPRSCGDPGFVSNGHRVGSLFTFANSVRYECDQGFRLVGKATRYCGASGSWSGRLPHCESITCKPPDNPEHGHVTYTSLEFGSKLKVECDRGYLPSDTEPVTCTSDGTWSRAVSTCVESTCDIPRKPDHGAMELIGSAESPRAGTIAVFSCEEGRTADGPTTSKCLDIGQWTFPAPQCLEPCKIPPVQNGRIGRYVKKYYPTRLEFAAIPVGAKLEDNEKLFLHCSNGYSPLGSEDWQAKVSCSGGKWAKEPFCEPSGCRSHPPEVQNGRAEIIDSKHGGTVYYSCFQDFVKYSFGNITCYFGEWKGVTPTCKDTRCFTDMLNIPGLEKGNKRIYRDGEELHITCSRRFKLATGHSGSLKCQNGAWEKFVPPCVAASCSDPPPPINHGRAEFTSMTHNSIARYICDDPYEPVGNNQLQCLFGEWTGQPPKCEDNRCFLKDLQHQTGVSPNTPSVTYPGDRLSVLCYAGYEPRSSLPVCLNGAWNHRTESPCKEKDCTVEWIPYGIMKKQRVGPEKCNWLGYNCQTPITYTNVPMDSVFSRGASLFLFCYYGYSLQGKGVIPAKIHCAQGRWSPDPVCLLHGMKYIPTTKAFQVTTQTNNRMTHSTSSRTTALKTPIFTTPTSRVESITSVFTEGKVEPAIESKTPTKQLTEEDICSCEYTLNDGDVVAYLDGKQLEFQGRVTRGKTVKFRCKNVGFQKLVGSREIMCEDCQPWHSSVFPQCGDPKIGDALIFFDKNVNVSLDGALEVRSGQTIRLTCMAMEEAEFHEWETPNEQEIRVETERKEIDGAYVFLSHLDIENPSPENEGLYKCAVGNNAVTVVELHVIDPDVKCPKFEDTEELIITYDMDTHVGSQATFRCGMKDQMLNGTDVLTCLRNGHWSSHIPSCTEMKCSELKETDLMKISYTDDRRIGSFANFHCFAPGTRSGVARTRCLENGQWENPTPTCRAPPCSSEYLFSSLPQGVTLEMEDVTNDSMPYNSTVRLMCGDEDLFPVGNPVAKCGRDGTWTIDSVQCSSGCLPPYKRSESKLIMLPEKSVYTFGESITFSCPPGLDLNQELQKIMCLNGWSENNLPECVDKDTLELDDELD